MNPEFVGDVILEKGIKNGISKTAYPVKNNFYDKKSKPQGDYNYKACGQIPFNPNS
jgi:hypothetical protein